MRRFSLTALLFTGMLLAQRHPVDPSERYYRLICLVHVTGSGTLADPLRPEYVPNAADATRKGILAWSFQITDDKSMAIMHVVASNYHAFDAILADTRPEIRVFHIGKDSRAAIEQALQQYKQGFSLDGLKVVAQ